MWLLIKETSWKCFIRQNYCICKVFSVGSYTLLHTRPPALAASSEVTSWHFLKWLPSYLCALRKNLKSVSFFFKSTINLSVYFSQFLNKARLGQVKKKAVYKKLYYTTLSQRNGAWFSIVSVSYCLCIFTVVMNVQDRPAAVRINSLLNSRTSYVCTT
jgi:hypothetical protein